MKRLVYIHPQTHATEVGCTFDLVGDHVVIEPASALEDPGIAGFYWGEQFITPSDGAAYYDKLEQIHCGTWYFIEDVPQD